jgi:hypothetical protein
MLDVATLGSGRMFQLSEQSITDKGLQIVDYIMAAGFVFILGAGLSRIIQAVGRHDPKGAFREIVNHVGALAAMFLFIILMYAVKRFFG